MALLCSFVSCTRDLGRDRAVKGRIALPLANEALLPTAQAKEAADSLRSLAAIMIGRRSRTPRR